MVSLVWNADDAKKFYMAEAREEGRAEERVSTTLENVRSLMDSLQLTAAAAMNALKISPEMQKKLAPLI